MLPKQILLLSSSQVNGHAYLEYSKKFLVNFFKKNNVKQVTFVPYAVNAPDYDRYTRKVGRILSSWGFDTKGIHESKDPVEAIESSECIFMGGGNTFVLMNILYEKGLVDPIRSNVLRNGLPYLGASAGSVIASKTIQTTNNMPIVQPPSFSALNLVPFNINAHYFYYVPERDDNRYQGITREEDLVHYTKLNECPVLALRNESCILIEGDSAKLFGPDTARYYTQNNEPIEIEGNSDLSFMFTQH